MYDATNNLEDQNWYDYKECNIINFSKTLHNKCLEYGFSSFYIQYFPELLPISNWGNEKSMFFWQRIDSINPNIIEKIINPQNIDNFYIHNVPDPMFKSHKPSSSWDDKVVYSSWFDSKQDLLKYIQKSALYIAPREYEGFGNSYLDAMACGRCVIALDNPAMNEYIKNGETGFLYSLDNLQYIEINDIRKIQKNTVEYMKQGRNNWQKNKINILTWIIHKPKIDWIKIIFKYFIQKIFSIKNAKNHKIVRILGFKIKIKIKRYA